MDFSHVTFASEYEQESILKHTKVFQNKNLSIVITTIDAFAVLGINADIGTSRTSVAKMFAEKENVKKDCKFNKANKCANPIFNTRGQVWCMLHNFNNHVSLGSRRYISDL